MPPSDLYDSQLSSLIAHLYDTALDDSLWPGTAARIARSFSSPSTVLKLHGDGAWVNLIECTENLIVSEREQAWAEHWHRRDLWVERSLAHGMFKIITDEDLVTPEEQLHSGFYRDWLRHLGIYHMLGAVFPTTDGATGVLGIHRPREAGAYAPADRMRAQTLLTHLQRAMRLGQRLAEASRSHAPILEALDRLDTGVFIVDGTCRIIHASAMAETLLCENKELAAIGGRLSLRQPAQHDKLLAMVRAAMGSALGKPAQPGAAFSVPRTHRLPLTLEVVPLRPSTHPIGRQRPTVLIFVRDPEAPITRSRLRDLFGLTGAESSVAAALGRGNSVEEISAAMGIGLSTARSHLKRILAKTGTHRQAQAAALIARSIGTKADDIPRLSRPQR
nr:helix-turn-helix transcriptional regulator [uncultured Steroidobacter sp.]